MTNIFALVILSLVCGTYATGDDEVPVYIFTKANNEAATPYSATPILAFDTVDRTELTTILNSYGEDKKRIFIVVDSLSPEAFRMEIKGDANEQPQRVFQNLPTFKLLNYIQKADAANATIYETYSKALHTQFTTTNEFAQSIAGSNDIIVPWDSCLDHESYAQCLQRLDRVLGELVGHDDLNDAIFVLTAVKNPKLNVLSRKARAAAAGDGPSFKYDNLLAYYTKAYEHNKNPKEPSVEFKITNIKPDRTTDTEMDVIFESASYNIVITFTELGGTWAATSVTLNGNPVYVYTGIAAPRGFSFACAKSFRIQANKSDIDYIVIQGLQIQPKFKSDPFDLSHFGEAYNCVGFTSPGIWAGIVVTLLLLIIMTIGITALMDIRTMDRFDDPKGKTITINANE